MAKDLRVIDALSDEQKAVAINDLVQRIRELSDASIRARDNYATIGR